ncbi:hypothetical protein M2480_000956 [Parabacteroides sp. PFB2-12]|uniref:DUF4384 domain-containing protein n=1 Tax=unclassified Parabacteroides TaxID=2649774 RepID=UPI002473EF5E|nr:MULTISPECIES: DUF4384 domain-containing protein [unclassified Parabacteroides]MDH6341587.1 hypothetical protein [Parabacteroides sp. PM6-13]MDH6389990.1 hypothetical protein [Parabacteroides sp. PFB2-12]
MFPIFSHLKWILIPIFLTNYFSLFELKSQTVEVQVSGIWEMANITPEKARLYALNNAKENALREAGISEEFIIMHTGAVSDKITRFISHSNSELLGEIVNYEVIDERIQSQGKRHYYQIMIKATVKTGKVKRDIEFDVQIKGIKNTAYRDGEMFIFSITPTKDCYATVFWLDESGNGALIYPNPAEPTEKLLAQSHSIFPRTQNYKARKETKEPTEIISLVFVFTKQNIPFTQDCTWDNIQKWIMAIPSDKHTLKYNSIVVTD